MVQTTAVLVAWELVGRGQLGLKRGIVNPDVLPSNEAILELKDMKEPGSRTRARG